VVSGPDNGDALHATASAATPAAGEDSSGDGGRPVDAVGALHGNNSGGPSNVSLDKETNNIAVTVVNRDAADHSTTDTNAQ
jgi:hypothetical protein